jgi:hypothetical protein
VKAVDEEAAQYQELLNQNPESFSTRSVREKADSSADPDSFMLQLVRSLFAV